ncbi:MAG: ribonuclease P protein component [Planctomycetota bacterium]|jgi:ribonuclease P protein component|nr:ribonuclease P protein component [Planctomycetota bacterium]
METLPREERLRGRKLIDRIFREGSRGAAGKAAARALANSEGRNRLAAMAGKALGGAVKRSRMRRRIRAAWREQKGRLPLGWDVALLARPGLLEAKWQDVRRDVILAAERSIRDASGQGRRPRRP